MSKLQSIVASGALCTEMEGVGLFTVANYRKCRASAIYIVSDIIAKDDWSLCLDENTIDNVANKLIAAIIYSILK